MQMLIKGTEGKLSNMDKKDNLDLDEDIIWSANFEVMKTEVLESAERKTSEDNIKKVDVKDLKMEFDDLLPYAGEFGLYQFFIALTALPFYTFGVFVYFTQIFLTEVPSDHWCWIPELHNLTATERKSLAIPLDANELYGYSKCQSYSANWSEVLMGEKLNYLDTIPCQHGWEFNFSDVPYPTISSDLDWVCDKSSYQATAQSIFFFGSIVGLIFIGHLADKFGRLPAVVICNAIGCIGGVATMFSRNFLEFAICRFVIGLSYDNCMVIAYVLVLEYIAPKYRTFIANTTFAISYTISSASLPWIALACGHWQTLSLVTSLPLALTGLGYLFLRESPRWLLSKGRINDVIEGVLSVGKINQKEIPQHMIDQFKESEMKKKEDKGNTIDIFKRPAIRKMFILICVVHTCCDILLDVSVRTLNVLNFNFFISFSVVSLAELPGSLTVALVMDKVGRRKLTCVTMMMTFIFCLLTDFVKDGLAAILCAVVVRYSVSVCYAVTYQWTVELLPTPVRASGVSLVHLSGYVGTLLVQYVVYLGLMIVWLPLVVAAGLAALGSITCLLLPETTGKDMPQTFEDAENLWFESKKVEDIMSNVEGISKSN